MTKLFHQITLIYYDNPQLAVAVDEVDTKYVCLLVEELNTTFSHCCVPISKRRLGLLLTNQVDLLPIFTERETEHWLKASTEDITHDLSRVELQSGQIPQAYLPASGLFVSPAGATDELVDSARERMNLVSEVAVEPPEASNNVISARTLSLLLDAFQSIVKHAVTASKRAKTKKSIRSQPSHDIHVLDVYAFSQGSFKIRFESRTNLDLLGDSEVQAAFELIEEVISKASDPEAVATILEEYKGHFVTSLIKLLRIISENKTYFSFAWAKPEFRQVRTSTIELSSVASLLELLSRREEMLLEKLY